MKPFTPNFTKLPKRTVLTIRTVGDPNKMDDVFKSLYGTAYTTKFKVFRPKGKDMTVGPCSAFWPNAHTAPKAKWIGIWNLEVSPFVKQKDLIQKNPDLKVKIGTLPAGTYAQILHVGPYSSEGPTVQKLHDFVKVQKYRLAGMHEEAYLTKPGPKAKTIIRYKVARK